MARPHKVVLIGLDAAVLDLLERYSKKGITPNMRKLMMRGAYMEAFSSMPPGTAMNWNTIATGAHVGTHGVPGMGHREPGSAFNTPRESAFFSNYRQAETLWEAAERSGRVPMLLKYTTSWPPTIKKGIQVEGFGDPGYNVNEIAPRMCFCTYEVTNRFPRKYAADYKVRVGKPENWTNLPCPENYKQVNLGFYSHNGESIPLWGLITKNGTGEYNQIDVFSNKDYSKKLGTLHLGKWSEWIRISVEEGRRMGIFKLKLMELSDDRDVLKIYSNRMFPENGWTRPPELAKELVEKIGPYQELSAIVAPYIFKWVDEETIMEEVEYQARWLSEAARYLMSSYKWDLFMTQWHGIDHMSHLFLGGTDEKCIYFNPKRKELCEHMMETTYKLADDFVAAILENTPDDAIVAVVSDHGQVPIRVSRIDVNGLLEKEGLLSYDEDGRLDVFHTKAANLEESTIQINLEGREQFGCVKPDEYEQLRSKIIKLLEDIKDPKTGERILQLVLRTEDAQCFGFHGPRVGDIVFFFKTHLSKPTGRQKMHESDASGTGLYSTANGEHHAYWQTAKTGDLNAMRAMLILKGPNIKRGFHKSTPVHLVDVAPTLAYLSGFYRPRQAEGRILHELFKKESLFAM